MILTSPIQSTNQEMLRSEAIEPYFSVSTIESRYILPRQLRNMYSPSSNFSLGSSNSSSSSSSSSGSSSFSSDPSSSLLSDDSSSYFAYQVSPNAFRSRHPRLRRFRTPSHHHHHFPLLTNFPIRTTWTQSPSFIPLDLSANSQEARKEAPTLVSSSLGASASAVLHGSAASSISLMLSKKPIVINYPTD